MAIAWILALVASIGLLVKSSDIFIDSAEKIGQRLGIASFVLGITVVAVGTSLPELVTALFAISKGDPALLGVPVENVVGSNIANTLIVIGIGAIVAKGMTVTDKLIDVDIPFLFISTSLLLVFIWDRQFTAQEGFLSLLFFAAFFTHSVIIKSKEKRKNKKKGVLKARHIILFFVAIIGIFIGGKYSVNALVKIIEIFNLEGTEVITMIVIALGTSLPEIIMSTKAARRGKYAVALGNVFGSNTFNALIVTSVPSFFATLTVSELTFNVGIPFLLISIFAFLFISYDDKIRGWEGVAILIVYIVFLAKLTGLA